MSCWTGLGLVNVFLDRHGTIDAFHQLYVSLMAVLLPAEVRKRIVATSQTIYETNLMHTQVHVHDEC